MIKNYIENANFEDTGFAYTVIFLKINSRRPQNSLMRRHPVGTA